MTEPGAADAASRAVLRPTREEDLVAVSELTHRVFGRRRSIELLRWLLLDPGMGEDLQSVVAEEDGCVVGHAAVVTGRYAWRDRVMTGSHAILWMLLAESRGTTGVKLGRFAGRHGDFTLVIGGTPKSQPILERRRFSRPARAVELRLPVGERVTIRGPFELGEYAADAGSRPDEGAPLCNSASASHLRWLAACPELDSCLLTLYRTGEPVGPVLLYWQRRSDPPAGRIVHLPWLGEAGWRAGLAPILERLAGGGCESASLLAADPGLIQAATALGGRPFYERPVWFRAAAELEEPADWHLTYLEGDLAYRNV